MKAGKILKNIVISTCICGATFSVGDLLINKSFTPHSIVAYADERVEVSINNSALYNRLINLLGKEAGSKLYKDDFLVNENYKTEDQLTANRKCLDLSNSGITDIAELIQFQFPETLSTIDLSKNGITLEQLEKISNILGLKLGDTHEIVEPYKKTLTSASDFSTIIKKVNIGINNIDLKNIAINDLKSDGKYGKFIFGIQNLPLIDKSELVNSTELSNTYYYMRENDNTYYQDLIIFKNGTNPENKQFIVKDTVTPLINITPEKLANSIGRYSITLGDPSNLGEYFTNDYTYNFDLISINLIDEFFIERNTIFSGLSNEDIVLKNAFPYGYRIETVSQPSTYQANIAVPLEIKITTLLEDGKDGRNRIFKLYAPIKDTTKPTLELVGPAKIYLSQNTSYSDQGVIVRDNYEKLSNVNVKAEGIVNPTKIGTYTIKYTCVDNYGNQSDPIYRTVVVEKSVLDSMTAETIGDTYIGQDIKISLTPDKDINVSDYKDYKYYVYQNDVLFRTITGDAVTGLAEFTVNFTENTTLKIVLKATRKSDGVEMTVQPIYHDITLTNPPTDYTKLLIIAGGCIGFIGLIFVINIIKKKVKKKKTNKKETKQKRENVEIVKNFTGDGVSKEFMEAMQTVNKSSTVGQNLSNNQLGDLVDNITLKEGDIPPNQFDHFGPLNSSTQNSMPVQENTDIFIENIAENTNNAVGKIDVAKVPADQAIDGGTHPEAGTQINNIGTADDNGDIWI